MFKKTMLAVALTALPLVTLPVHAERLKDIAVVEGVRTNQLIGYGLVVGLEGTGDKTKFTSMTAKNLLANFGVPMPDGVDPKSKNIAAVAISADLPPFAKPGQRLDVTVSSLGDSKSLRGGTLLMTALRGADGEVYALAQGSLVVSGFGAQGKDGSRIASNISSVGRIANGASIERAAPSGFMDDEFLTFNLNSPDFTTARRVAEGINEFMGPDTARAIDSASIEVIAPADSDQRVTYLSVLENINITPAEENAKVVINSRTGTIIISENVKVSPVAVTHGGISVTITEGQSVSQPDGTLAGGQTVVTPRSDIAIDDGASRMFEFKGGASLQAIVDSVNSVGAAPGDLMAILEALKQAGALKAELVII